MSSDYLLTVENIGKCYHLYSKPVNRLYQMVLGRFKNFYKEFWALRNITFSVRKGETVGIIGKNGSGKSTLLQIIAGILLPTEGKIDINGKVSALLELGSGFHPEFTGRENIYVYCSVLGLNKREIDEIVDEIISFADIGEFIDQPIKTYSSGMLVRLAFASAINVKPDILIIDEALAVGDIAFQQKCLSKIRKMQERGVTILLVTHSTNILIEYCDRGIYLRNGILIMDGDCRKVVKKYTDDIVDNEGGITIHIDEMNENIFSEVEECDKEMIMNSNSNENKATNKPLILFSEIKFLKNGEECIVFNYGEYIKVRVTVNVLKEVSEPCFGIQISSPDGIALWSNTTQNMNYKMDKLSIGTYKFEWILRCNFNGGRYIVSLGVGEVINGEYHRHHRLDYAGHFDVMYIKGIGSGWLVPFAKFGEVK